MVKDLSQILVKDSANKQKVKYLLGEPKLQKSENRWSYYSGTSTMDCLSFDIIFDEKNMVMDSKLIQY